MDAVKKLLVIDDEPAIREGVRRILEAESFQVETFSNGQAALERLRQESFDLVVTDLKMPGISGMDVLKTIKERHPDLPVIFITGYSSVDNAVEAMKRGAVDYLAKPFNREEVLKVIRTALEQRVVMRLRINQRKAIELSLHRGGKLHHGNAQIAHHGEVVGPCDVVDPGDDNISHAMRHDALQRQG